MISFQKPLNSLLILLLLRLDPLLCNLLLQEVLSLFRVLPPVLSLNEDVLGVKAVLQQRVAELVRVADAEHVDDLDLRELLCDLHEVLHISEHIDDIDPCILVLKYLVEEFPCN